MAGVKITDLTPLATASSDDLLYIVDVSDTTQSPQGTSKSIEVANIARPYKVYSALLTQSGVGAPISIELENSIEGVISFEYLSTGIYKIVNSLSWDIDKTWYSIAGQGDIGSMSAANPTNIKIGFEGDLLIYAFNSADTSIDDALLKTPIEIRVYN